MSGLTQKFDAAGPGDVAAIMAARMAGKPVNAAYTLDDMAADAAGLLDALGIKKAHIVGASMGGMIAQLVAARHAGKTLSLTSIMSTTGNPNLPPAKPEAMAVLMSRPESDDMEYLAIRAVTSQKVIGSPAYPADDAEIKARAIEDYKRSFHPVGFTRQIAAIMASGDRRAARRHDHGADHGGARRCRSAGAGRRRARHGGDDQGRAAGRDPGHGARPAAGALQPGGRWRRDRREEGARDGVTFPARNVSR